ncbi:MAG TPA: FUSC family protein [Casimicrobiaceae bacterium]|nr:FUSC family protein [Casimicrobiaceae bacterium]
MQLDRDGLDVAAGVRAGICLVVPVAVGVATGHTLDGLIASLGSLNVAMAEGVGSYSSRAATLGSVLVGNALSIAAGTLTALAGWWGVLILMAWVFVAAYVGVIGPVAERTGWFAALMFMIGIGFGDPSVANAGRYAVLAAVGGMWAIIVITVFWPFHPHRPFVRAWGRSIAAVADLLKLVAQSASDGELDRAVVRAESLGHAAEAVTHWHAVRPSRSAPMPDHLHRLARAGEQARTYAMILVEALRRRAEPPDSAADTRMLAGVLGQGLAAVSGDLDKNGQPGASSAAQARRISERVANRLAPDHEHERELSALRRVLASLGGDTDEVIALDAPLARAQPAPPQAALRANLSPSSFWFRYALRFSIAVGVGLAVDRYLGLAKGYWVLITIAVVVKPQLSLSTTSTIHRVIGTLLGALLGILLIISLPSAWGLIAALFVVAVMGISLARVNYGLAVVFITPMVLVLLNVADPGHWQVADIRVVNTLLGATIGVLATSAILPGSERGLIIERSLAALTSSAGYMHAIAHRGPPERLAARRSARASADNLLAVVDRAMAEPTTLQGSYLNAASRIAAAIAELWAREAELALSVPAEQMTPVMRLQIDAAAARVSRMTRVLAGSDVREMDETDRSLGGAPGPAGASPLPGSLIEVIESAEAACANLSSSVSRIHGRATHRRGAPLLC